MSETPTVSSQLFGRCTGYLIRRVMDDMKSRFWLLVHHDKIPKSELTGGFPLSRIIAFARDVKFISANFFSLVGWIGDGNRNRQGLNGLSTGDSRSIVFGWVMINGNSEKVCKSRFELKVTRNYGYGVHAFRFPPSPNATRVSIVDEVPWVRPWSVTTQSSSQFLIDRSAMIFQCMMVTHIKWGLTRKGIPDRRESKSFVINHRNRRPQQSALKQSWLISLHLSRHGKSNFPPRKPGIRIIILRLGIGAHWIASHPGIRNWLDFSNQLWNEMTSQNMRITQDGRI
jgi:hypothetical protein